MTSDVLLLDSITDAGPAASGKVSVCGSHGGLIAASLASTAELRAVILNDAGIGLRQAGLRGVMALDQVGMAAAAVDCMSACIGDAKDMLDAGILSAANDSAHALGLYVGQRVTSAVPMLKAACAPGSTLAPPIEARFDVELCAGVPSILCTDSASLITPKDAGRVIVTGSHGGLIGADPARACKAQAAFVAFNDAGVGKDQTGFGRLAPLQHRGIAAAVLHAESCEIGDARSSLETGRISAMNECAAALGLRVDEKLSTGLLRMFGNAS